MNLKTTLTAGFSSTILVLAASSVAADGNLQDIRAGFGNGLHTVGGATAVSTSSLQQNSVQITTSALPAAADGTLRGQMDFGELSFSNQMLNNNNFNAGGNAVQGNSMAISIATDGDIGGGLDLGAGF